MGRDGLPAADVACCNTLLSAYERGGMWARALDQLAHMKGRGNWSKPYGWAYGDMMMTGGEGCDKCGGGGYKGRMGIHEYMTNSDELRAIIYRNGKVAELREQALKEGMLTLKQDGIRKVLQGFSDITEIRRVCIK